MSSQRGNPEKKKPPKYANKTAFKNDLHDTNKRTKVIRELEVTGCCDKCRKVIEWKIKYKKYKPLTVPKRCVKCQQKTVLNAYNIVCTPCATLQDICAKCSVKLSSNQDSAGTEKSVANDSPGLAAVNSQSDDCVTKVERLNATNEACNVDNDLDVLDDDSDVKSDDSDCEESDNSDDSAINQ